MHRINSTRRGFTLVEMSIALVVVGLIVGGILVGQDLIRAAGVRATIAQIEKYNMAVNTFLGKYGGLPGDLNAPTAARFGFTPRGQYAGEGDGNGLIEGVDNNVAGANFGCWEASGETVMFWVDLSTANGLNVSLIDGSFSTASPNNPSGMDISGAGLDSYFPQAKIGGGNYVYVWSGGWGTEGFPGAPDGINYFGLSAVTKIAGSRSGQIVSNPGLTVQQAYSIDKKVDDGMPQSGNVIALYLNSQADWSAGGGNTGGAAGQSYGYGPTNGPVPWAATNCYDNNNTAGPQTYSIAQNANQVNCALSFRFQ